MNEVKLLGKIIAAQLKKLYFEILLSFIILLNIIILLKQLTLVQGKIF